MCNYGMNILQHPIFYGEYLLYEIIAFHPLPHRRYPITISLYPIGANTPRHTCSTCCCSMIPVHSVACDHDNTWDVTPSLLPHKYPLAATRDTLFLPPISHSLCKPLSHTHLLLARLASLQGQLSTSSVQPLANRIDKISQLNRAVQSNPNLDLPLP